MLQKYGTGLSMIQYITSFVCLLTITSEVWLIKDKHFIEFALNETLMCDNRKTLNVNNVPLAFLVRYS